MNTCFFPQIFRQLFRIFTTHTMDTILRKMTAVASIAAGVQFGWALQFSILIPFIQELGGVSHEWIGYICVFSRILGLVVQPLVGYYSDRSRSNFGRRRPFIFYGIIAVAMSSLIIMYAADLGHSFGDHLAKSKKPRTIAILVLDFSMFDVANNVVQASCRAFIGDLAAGDHRRVRTGNSLFSFFKAVGNLLGYLAASHQTLFTVVPFVETKACQFLCANMKICFFISILLLVILSTFALLYVVEVPLTEPQPEPQASCIAELLAAFHGLPQSMWMLMLVMGINWVAWFPFFLFNIDWMGREIYGGGKMESSAYFEGVRAGTLGLMLKSLVSSLMSLAVKPLGRYMGGAKRLWGAGNVVLGVCLTMTVVITKVAEHERHKMPSTKVAEHERHWMPSTGVKTAAFIFYAVIGLPLAINFSVPYALASIYCSATGIEQGLYLGALNISILISEIIVSTLSGPWDSLFGGSNLPSFVVGALAAAISGVLAIVVLPTPTP